MTEPECCRCHEKGAVWNRYCDQNREASSPCAINWVCVHCRGHVCINCILTIPNSMPIEIRTPAYCSETCRSAWLTERKAQGLPTYEDEDEEELSAAV